ncbi:MAG: HAMP domain-containing protein [Cyanothece sp. SIO1E1]|nr:HAMP domain-containing protein [Cyanothece sp. SIO1E1]
MTTLHPQSNAVSQNPPNPLASAQLNSKSEPSPDPPNLGLKRRFSIRTLVVASFIIPILTAVGLTGWLSIRNGQKAVTTLASQLSDEVASKVEDQIQTFVNQPYQFLRINLAAVQTGKVNLEDLSSLEKYFWYQTQITNAVPNLYFGTQKGNFVGVWQESEALTTLRFRDESTAPNRITYKLTQEGERQNLINVQEYDHRLLPWYRTAVQAGEPIWSPVYIFSDLSTLSITHAIPIYNEAKSLLGVIAIDLNLADISSWLQEIEISPSGAVFIMERSGEIIASSIAESALVETNDGKQRLVATDSINPLIQGAAVDLQQRFGGFEQIKVPKELTVTISGERHFLQVTPIQNAQGLDWLAAVVIPETDFITPIKANTQNTIGLCLFILVIATGAGIVTSRWITTPILRLNQASEAIAAGDLNQTVEVDGLGELQVLSQTFNQMSHKLADSFHVLTTVNTELKEQVAERSTTLDTQNQVLQQEVEHLLEVVIAVESGDLTVAATVSPEVMGIIAETFNHLIERLSQIMTNVVDAVEQVAQGTGQVEDFTADIVDNTQRQTQCVAQVQQQVENASTLSESTTQQAIAASEAVQHTEQMLKQGGQELTTMTNGIGTLQQETERIAKRIQTLTGYVDLSAQFTKDQKRIVAETRVLALNASMLSTRASEQRDPEQFASITREFETIANQVNALATQTNQSLVLLKQRTDQIQTVVSGLNHDIEEVSQQVTQVGSGVDRSRLTFDTLKTATQQVAQIATDITQASQAIAQANQTTLQSVHDISTMTAETSTRATLSKEQAGQMKQLAHNLLQRMQFFHLRSEPTSPLPITSADDPQVLSSVEADLPSKVIS